MTENIPALIEEALEAHVPREVFFGYPVEPGEVVEEGYVETCMCGEQYPCDAVRLVKALEKVTAERDEAWRVAAEQTRMERGRADGAEAERDAAYAALEQEREWWETMREDHAEHLMILRDASLRRLSTVPADALREVKAQAWNEALLASAQWHQDQRYYVEDEVPNPYREGADHG